MRYFLIGSLLFLNGCAMTIGYNRAHGDNRICFPCIDAGEHTVGVFGWDDSWGTAVYSKK